MRFEDSMVINQNNAYTVVIVKLIQVCGYGI